MCDDCHRLKSPSALYGPSSKYNDIIKPQRRMEKLRDLIRNTRKISDTDLRAYMTEYETLKTKMEQSPAWCKLRFEMEDTGRQVI